MVLGAIILLMMQEDQPKTPAWMYWRYAWRERDRVQFFRLYRLIPAILTPFAQFIWKRPAQASFSDLWMALAITVAVYLGLFIIETGWRFVAFTPPKIYDEQTRIIGDLHGQISAFQDEPDVSPTEQRRRDQVREQWRGFTPEEKVVLQFIHDKGEVNTANLREADLGLQALYDALQKGLKCGLIIQRRDTESLTSRWGGISVDVFWINPSLREALEFVISEGS